MTNMLHQQLKEKTKYIHSLLEEKSVFRYYMSKGLTSHEYLAIIAKTLQAYAQWQKQLDIFIFNSHLDNFWRIDLKSNLLNKELAVVNNIDFSSTIPPLSLENIADYLACAYVFEGSKLGSKVIYKTLTHNENLNQQEFYYFRQLAQSTSDHITWSHWMELFECYVSEKCISIDDITSGAVNCFETLYAWFGIEHASAGVI
jgi:heme oxygenase